MVKEIKYEIFGYFFNNFLGKYFSEERMELMSSATPIPPSMKSNKINVILVLQGSFNPIHKGHEETIIRAMNYINNNHKEYLNYIISIIVPLKHESLLTKFEGNEKEIIPFETRLRMCEIACGHPVQTWWYTWDNSKTDLSKVKDLLKKEALKLGFKLEFITVFGGDLYINNLDYKRNTMWVSRKGYENNIPRKEKDDFKKLFFIVRNSDGLKISSTEIRNRIKCEQRLNAFLDDRILSNNYLMKSLRIIFQADKINKLNLELKRVEDLKIKEINQHNKKIEELNQKISDLKSELIEIEGVNQFHSLNFLW